MKPPPNPLQKSVKQIGKLAKNAQFIKISFVSQKNFTKNKKVLDIRIKKWYNICIGNREPRHSRMRKDHEKYVSKKAVDKILKKMDAEARTLSEALTVRQRRFCEEYALDYNGKAAAIRAGYAPTWADRQAYQLLKVPAINAYVDYLTRSKEVKISSVNPEYLLGKLNEIISSTEVKDADKLRGIEMYMRHLGMFIDKQEITGKDGGAIEVEQRRVEEEAASFTSLMKQLKDRHEKDQLSIN